MDWAIDLYNQPYLSTVEISDETTEGMLRAKSQAIQLPISGTA
jgi:hypothetical protein